MKQNILKMLSLLLVMALLLAGCSGQNEDISGKVEPNPTEKETQSAETEPAETENPLSLGRMEGGTYTNAYAGFGCTLDESWIFYSAAELQELPENVANAFEDGSEMAELMEQYQQIMDMKAENVDLLCTVNVLFQEVSFQNRAAILALGEKGTIEAMIRDQGDFLVDTYAQVGIEVTDIQPITVTFLGEEHTALHTIATQSGTPLYMTQILDYTRGSYSVTITFTSYGEDRHQAVMDLFFAVE